jgi:hypothetical protein
MHQWSKISKLTLIEKTNLEMVVQTYNLSTWKAKAGESQVQGWPGLHDETLSQKNQKKRAGEVAQVVERLPSKREALRSNSSAAKKKKNDIQFYFLFCILL